MPVFIAAESTAARLPSCASWETPEASHNHSRPPSFWLKSIQREVSIGVSTALPWATTSSVQMMADIVCLKSWPGTRKTWLADVLFSIRRSSPLRSWSPSYLHPGIHLPKRARNGLD